MSKKSIKKAGKESGKKVPITKTKPTKTETPRPIMQRERFWTPFEMMRRFDHEMDELSRSFDEWFRSPKRWPRHGAYHLPAVRQPVLDIEDTGKNIEIRAEIPGIPKENIDIKLTENNLEISAKSQTEKEEKGREYYHRERSFHSFYRNIPLPTEVEQSKADAKLENGILKIIIPKRKPKTEEKVHKVKIK